MKRELLGLLVADAVAYSGRIEENEVEAFAALETSCALISAEIDARDGKIVRTTGDGLIARFPNAVAAVSAAQAAQKALGEAGEAVFVFRIGVHFGDVVITEDDFHGDGLNIAARLEPLAPPGAVCISSVVADQIAGKRDEPFSRVGIRRLKNIVRKVEVYCWPETAARAMRHRAMTRLWPIVAVFIPNQMGDMGSKRTLAAPWENGSSADEAGVHGDCADT